MVFNLIYVLWEQNMSLLHMYAMEVSDSTLVLWTEVVSSASKTNYAEVCKRGGLRIHEALDIMIRATS